MLIEFRVENHKSLRHEQVLTFEAGRIASDGDLRPRTVEGYNESLLPAAVIYGANASGKSNVLSALAFMKDAVQLSHRRWAPDEGVPRTPFAWGGMRNQPSMFEVTFVLDETKYEYGFSATDEIIDEEWLFAWPNHRKQIWFEREGSVFKFGDLLKGPNETTREVTRPNSLFLSAAAQNSHPQLSHVYSWFSRIHPVNISHATPNGLWRRTGLGFSPSYLSQLLSSDEEEQGGGALNGSDDSLIRSLRHLMQSADVGIVDIKRVETDIDVGGGRYARRAKFQFQHAANDDESWLDLEDESDGTRTLFRMCPSVFRALDIGGLLVVDELESDLHPLIGAAIVRLFNCPQTNPKNAQILFSTHDTNLLSAITDEPPMRRDQVWLAEKDKEGASQIYPLTDYKPRKAENLERGYLQGRYGAIPFLGSLVSSQE